jgi:DNA-binding winged helix-turn-helix (wHTH) protein
LIEKRIYQFGDFHLDTAERVIQRAGQPLSISPKALDVLIALIENRGRIVEKEDLMKKVWTGTFVEENNLTSTIYVLRKLFGESAAAPRYIENVPKRGYRFIAEVAELPHPHLAELATGNIAGLPLQETNRQPRPWRLVSALLLTAGITIVVYTFHRTPRLTDKDTIVLADFVNSTGDPVFDGTLREGLTVQLEQSPFLKLISQERIQQTLRLMNQPVDARLTPELAHDICERTASAAVLDGSIDRLGSQYILVLRAMNCRTGDILAEDQVQAARKEDVLNALSQIGDKFRVRVGESLATVEKHATPLAEATTSSLDALKAYSAAWKLLASTGPGAALPFFKRATEIDPKFAMAHGFLGRMYGDLGEAELSAESTRMAWQLRDHTSDREKFWITASYETQVLGNMEKARATCEFWARTYPRDAAPHDLLSGIIYPVLGQYQNALQAGQRAVELDPDFAISYNVLALNYQFANQPGEAKTIVQRAFQHKLELPDLFFERYMIAFIENDKAAMERTAAPWRQKLGADDWLSSQEALVLAYSGRLREAKIRSQQAVGSAQQAEQSERAALSTVAPAVWSAFFENARESKSVATAALKISKARDVKFAAAFVLAAAGDSSAALTLAKDLQTRLPEDTSVLYSYLPVVRARVALNAGEPAKAIELLQTTIPYELSTPASSYFGVSGALYPIYLRGEAYLALHNGSSAAREFQKILDHRGIVISDPIGALAHLQIGRALSLSGDKAAASRAYQDFFALWKDADTEIPIFKQAKAEHANLQTSNSQAN